MPEYRVNIVEAGNTLYGFPLRLLDHRGYTVLVPPNRRPSDEHADLVAIHPDGKRLIASTPLALLGLLSIVDHLGDDWYTKPSIDLLSIKESVDWPINLSPDEIRDAEDGELPAYQSAFALLCRLEGYDIAVPTTREGLLSAVDRYLELAEPQDDD